MELVLYTGRKGNFLFHTLMEISCLNKKELKIKYYNSQSELFDLKDDMEKIKSHWLIKLLIRLKLLKL